MNSIHREATPDLLVKERTRIHDTSMLKGGVMKSGCGDEETFLPFLRLSFVGLLPSPKKNDAWLAENAAIKKPNV